MFFRIPSVLPDVQFFMSFRNTTTNYMEQEPSLEANSGSACQEIPRISWKPNIHYSFHNRSPLDSSLSQINPLHALAFEEHNGHTKFWSFVASKLFMLYSEFRSKSHTHAHTHTHTHTHIYIQGYRKRWTGFETAIT